MQRLTQVMSSGFSLLEMVVVIAISGIVGSILMHIISTQMNAFFLQRDLTDMQWQTRLAMARITREISQIRTNTPADLIMTPNTEITFINKAGSNIRYWLNNQQLMRNNQVLAEPITNLQFTHIRNNGSTLATNATEVFYILVEFDAIQSGSVHLRNAIYPRRF